MEHVDFVLLYFVAISSLSFGLAFGFALGRRTLPPYTEVS